MCGGCATVVTKELPVVDARKVRLVAESGSGAGAASDDDVFEVSGVWRRSFEPFEQGARTVPVAARPEASPPPEPKPPTAIERLIARTKSKPLPKLRAPRPRSAKPRRPEGQRPGKSPERLAREHFLDYPTKVVAQRITFYCPANCASEVRLKADDVRQTHPTKRLARGNARLICRELTLLADRITLRIREAPDADLQIAARGDAGIVSTVRGQQQREEGLKSLLVTNDQLVPLR